MDVVRIELAGAPDPASAVVCDEPEKYGVVEVARHALKQWRMTREGIETFLAGELRLHVRSREGTRDRIRFGMSAQLSKLITLESRTTAELLIGDERIGLVELLQWDGSALHVDHHLMQLLPINGHEITGSKPYQKSRRPRTENASLQCTATRCFRNGRSN
jgi:hypothetical protein